MSRTTLIFLICACSTAMSAEPQADPVAADGPAVVAAFLSGLQARDAATAFSCLSVGTAADFRAMMKERQMTDLQFCSQLAKGWRLKDFDPQTFLAGKPDAFPHLVRWDPKQRKVTMAVTAEGESETFQMIEEDGSWRIKGF